MLMRKRVVTITDRKGRSFQIEVQTPEMFARDKDAMIFGEWRTLQKGLIHVNDGPALAVKREGTWLTEGHEYDLFLGRPAAQWVVPFVWG